MANASSAARARHPEAVEGLSGAGPVLTATRFAWRAIRFGSASYFRRTELPSTYTPNDGLLRVPPTMIASTATRPILATVSLNCLACRDFRYATVEPAEVVTRTAFGSTRFDGSTSRNTTQERPSDSLSSRRVGWYEASPTSSRIVAPCRRLSKKSYVSESCVEVSQSGQRRRLVSSPHVGQVRMGLWRIVYGPRPRRAKHAYSASRSGFG